MCVLGTKLRLSVRVARALKHRTTYLAIEFISYDDTKASNKNTITDFNINRKTLKHKHIYQSTNIFCIHLFEKPYMKSEVGGV